MSKSLSRRVFSEYGLVSRVSLVHIPESKYNNRGVMLHMGEFNRIFACLAGITFASPSSRNGRARGSAAYACMSGSWQVIPPRSAVEQSSSQRTGGRECPTSGRSCVTRACWRLLEAWRQFQS